MNSILYDIIAFAIFVLDIWAIIHIVRSNTEILQKVLWVVLVVFLPVIGLIVWAVVGPRSNVRL